MAAYCMQPACHEWANKKDLTVPRDMRGFLYFFFLFSPSFSHITMPIAEAPCNSSTPCQHFTDPYWQGELKGGGGRARMLAGGREKEGGGGDGGVLG